MTKGTTTLLVILVLLGGVYAFYFTDWFRKPTVEILPQIRPSMGRRGQQNNAPVYPVSFAFDRELRLTELKVVIRDEAKTNKYPRAVWHLISDSNSIPTKSIMYGMPVRGMKPKKPKARAEVLEPDVTYRLLIHARGGVLGQVDFVTREAAQAAPR